MMMEQGHDEGLDLQGEGSGAKRRKRRIYRHTAQQTEKLEEVFKECHNPDEKKRQQLSIELSLAPHQIKFWFQNKRTQRKVQLERDELHKLRADNDRIRSENATLRDALKKAICPSCGAQPQLGDPYSEEQKLLMENAQLKEQLDCFYTTPYAGRTILQSNICNSLDGAPQPVHPMHSSSLNNSNMDSFGFFGMAGGSSSTLPVSTSYSQFQPPHSDSGAYVDPSQSPGDNKPLPANIMWNCSSLFK